MIRFDHALESGFVSDKIGCSQGVGAQVRFAGKTALITGAAFGIGRTAALALAAEVASVGL